MQAADKYAVNMTLAYTVALLSKDERTKIGAVVTTTMNEIVSTGYNGLPRRVDDDVPERHNKPEKHLWFEHAERNAVFNAARVGVSLNGCIMFTQGVPCAECARAVIQSGIYHVVVHKPWNDRNSGNYAYDQARQMFREAGVRLEEWDGELLSPIGWRRGAVASVCSEESDD